MLGKFKTVKASATMTNKETATVPIHPAFLPCQTNTAKTKTNKPKTTV
jgi:hypothetical protein